jgi:glutathione S-transferase
MKLYASPGSSFARKIRVMLIEKNVSHELHMLNLWEPNDLQTINPLGKVPALKLDDGRVLINSPLIADYIDVTYPSPRFIPVDPATRLEVRRWEALADGMMEAVGATLYETRFHSEATRSQAWLDRQRGKIDTGLAALESMLGSRPWCVGDAMSLADLSMSCHLGFITVRMPHLFPQDRYPSLARLWKTMEGREAMKKTVPPPA